MKQIGRKITRLESIDSTNNYTANLIKNGDLVHGSVILAVEQTNGRGQMGAEWHSMPGENLTMSLFLDDVNLSVEDQYFLTRFTALSIIDFLRKIGIHAQIKWPNDIYVGRNKIAGILIENVLSKSTIKKSIVGIGLNVNQEQKLCANATSLKVITGSHHSLDEVLFSLIGCFNARISGGLKTNQMEFDYLDHLYLLNQEATFSDKDGEFEGTITGVHPSGKLCVLKNGYSVLFGLKEIVFKN
jgi:BirA family biotin operon repressor/biotin-[acetyl-CoA-carboxylase] ligase